MLDLIVRNKDWLFSGVAVAVPLAVIGWLCSKRKSEVGKSSTYSVQQTHSGSGDNVGRDKSRTQRSCWQALPLSAPNCTCADRFIIQKGICKKFAERLIQAVTGDRTVQDGQYLC